MEETGRDVLMAAAAFVGGYLGQVRTRKKLAREVHAAVRNRVQRFGRAVAELHRRVANLEASR